MAGWGRRKLELAAAGVGLWLATGCASPPAEAETRLAELEAEEQRMDAALDSVEVRLLGNQSKVQLWQELEVRHRQVSAVHCKHADEHLMAMARHYEQQEAKARQLRKRRQVVTASAPAPLTAEELRGVGGP
jgi:Zn ribbon nucleic-acid-binding protein